MAGGLQFPALTGCMCMCVLQKEGGRETEDSWAQDSCVH